MPAHELYSKLHLGGLWSESVGELAPREKPHVLQPRKVIGCEFHGLEATHGFVIPARLLCHQDSEPQRLITTGELSLIGLMNRGSQPFLHRIEVTGSHGFQFSFQILEIEIATCAFSLRGNVGEFAEVSLELREGGKV